MNNEIYVVPKKGLIVRDPITMDPIPEEGANVPNNTYWLRRINDGDVQISKPSSPKEAKRK